jgi:sulfatase modifying factor 1
MKNTNLRKLLVLTLATAGLVTQTASALITIETVPVGNTGNTADTTTYGAVGYDYGIGKYEVTLNQYAAFLNAVGATDTYGLYNAQMGSNPNIMGIARSGASGSYTYLVIGSGLRPVTYVSWYDAARFVNWLHNGQPTGLQAAGTTETGAYTLTGNTGLIARNTNWVYGLPSEDEWYKAAYHQPVGQGGDSDNYWLYPMASNVLPNSRNGSASDANSGNFVRDDGLANGFNDGYAVSGSPTYSTTQQYLTDAGAFSLADSFYGTFDQGGSVWEWNDAVIGSARGRRGGVWNDTGSYLRATNRFSFAPSTEDKSLGFRVVIATIPEQPSLIPAFPGAEGYGRYSKGGRGGEVYIVTNLSDASIIGTLRYGCEVRNTNAQGQIIPRTIVFKTGGTITMARALTIVQPKLTIAGQTAPGGGICIRMDTNSTAGPGHPDQQACIINKASDVIIRYLRIRPGPGNQIFFADPNSNQFNDGMNIISGANVIIDHCSISWGWDENLDVLGYAEFLPLLGPQNVSIQNCIVSEALSRQQLDGAWLGSYGSLNDDDGEEWAPQNITYYNNFFAHNQQRSIRLQTLDTTPAPYQFVNNLIYNRRYFGASLSGYAHMDAIGNFYLAGPEIVASRYDILVKENALIYVSGNIGTYRANTNQAEWDVVGFDGVIGGGGYASSPAPTSYQSLIPFSSLTNITNIKSAQTAKDDILTGGDIGASKKLDQDGNLVSNRDAVDARAVNNAIGLNGTSVKDIQIGTGIYTYPALATGNPYTDTDNDGMSDAWEAAYGLNPNNAADRNGTNVSPQGYSNLEAFLSGLHGIPPTLGYRRLGNNIELSWSTNATGFTLQSATNLDASAVWSFNPPAPTVFGSNYVVTNSASGDRKFYRLKK